LIQTFKVGGQASMQQSQRAGGHSGASARPSAPKPAPIRSVSQKPAPARATAPVAADDGHSSKPSPAKAMVNKISSAFGAGGSSAPKADDGNWDEF
ncbi:MAG: hypothetical protein ABJN11_03660, partial [Lentilitoribacter sp.]